jgi:leucyl-tRNA synthetase
MRITAYAQRLLDGLETIDWPESLKESQRYWIGKSEGTSLEFKIESSKLKIEVFTTRPDTIFGVSFVTLAPEHELVEKITKPEQKAAVEEYVIKSKNRSERERQAEVTKVSGVFTGAYVEHPFTGKHIPIWIGDYVLAGYGTGAVMAVPGHDSRDYAFAKHFDLPILEVVAGGDLSKESYDAKEGKLIHSDFLNGLEVKAALKKAIEETEKRGLGKGKTNFRLRDAVFGRQRYWGEPIPIFYKPARRSDGSEEAGGDGIPHALEENELPLVLPEVDKFLPTEDGEPPLARAAANWKKDGKYDYEHTTMPGWAGSSWYFLRYMDPKNSGQFVSGQLAEYWQNVDLYIGGSEHATGHLLYVRFWTKFLKDMGFLNMDEPMKKLINQGMMQGRSNFVYRIYSFIENGKSKQVFISKNLLEKNGDTFQLKQEHNERVLKELRVFKKEDSLIKLSIVTQLNVDVNIVENDILDIAAFRNWREDFANSEFILDDNKIVCGFEVEKMSKSKYNVVSPDDICEKFGADTLRLYEMFLGPLDQSKPWNTNGITGVSGFLKKLWRLFFASTDASTPLSARFNLTDAEPTKAELKTLHKTIKKITEDIERFSFNTSVSNFMICVNELGDLKCNKRAILEPLLICLSPYAPHITEELWSLAGRKESITFAPFPEFNEAFLVEDSFTYPISFNGKMRFNLELAATLTVPEIEKEVMSNEEVQKYLEGKTPKKIIIVPKKIVNFVV